MPIKPPNLDDRRYDDIVREARALIPQYCPEWTNLGDADPGMTLVQLFSWMTEMTIYRLNRVPDKTYVHFLNFIGEERREARPAVVPVTFQLRGDSQDAAELPPFTRVSTRQREGRDALHFVTTEALTVHDCNVERVVAVRAGPRPMVREIPFRAHPDNPKALTFGGGAGVQPFRMDPIEHGPRAYTADQYVYLAHDDFRLMDFELAEGQRTGRLRIRSAGAENLPIGAIFRWEYHTGDPERPWMPVGLDEEEEEILGLPEITLVTHLPGQAPVTRFGPPEDTAPIPEAVREEKHWIRGTVDYERWLAHRMAEDLEITWRDDRGGEERPINNWEVRSTGRNLEFAIQDMPPVRAGWTVRFTMVDRGVTAGRSGYLPRYRFSWRRGEQWEQIPADRVRYQGTSIVLTGPFTEMASDGYNLRAERVETVFVRGFASDLDVELTWLRPVELFLAYGPETGAAAPIPTAELPCIPFQAAPTLPPLLGMKFFVGAEVLLNRAQKPVLVEIDVGFELEGEAIPEPADLYRLQLTYRAADTWRVVHDEGGRYDGFTFADLDPAGAEEPGRRTIKLLLDPKTQLRGLARAVISGRESAWLRLELTKATLTVQKDKKSAPEPVTLRIHAVRLGFDGVLGREVYEQPMPGVKVCTMEYRPHNRRLSRIVTRSSGRLAEDYPFDKFVDISDEVAGGEATSGHSALYFQLDKPLPAGSRHAVQFRTRGETYLPEGTTCDWEILTSGDHGRWSWERLAGSGDATRPAVMLNRSGVLEFPYPEAKPAPSEGVWLRALYRTPVGDEAPVLPPLSHVMLDTVDAVNLHAFRMEKYSGLGVPHQAIQLRRFPLFVHHEDAEQSPFPSPDRFPDLRVHVTEDDGQKREWRRAPGNTLLTATKDDRVFVVDPVEGTLTFGNGIRGRMLPVGTYNVTVDLYHTVPGEAGNFGPGEIAICEGHNERVQPMNLLPSNGGRNAESIEEIIRRAPSVLSSRDRAVTRRDFEIIALEASGEVARAACDGRMTADGEVGVVVLPRRREGERIPDPFLSAGLEAHVQRYLSKRCLVNVKPAVRLATFHPVDVALSLRLRPNANVLQVRERASAWVRRFLDPFDGGLDGQGWPFAGTLYAQDFGRMVVDIPEVRHVHDVQLFDMSGAGDDTSPGWEKGQGVPALVLDRADLFTLGGVRVLTEEGEA